MTTRRTAPKLHPGVTLSQEALRRLNSRRNPEIERQRTADKTFPRHDDPTIQHTDTPAEFVHPTRKR